MKILHEKETNEHNATEIVKNIKNWNSAFAGVVDAIKDVSNLIANPEAFEGKEKDLQRIFNEVEILKSTVGLDSNQKKLCSQVYDLLVSLAGHEF